MTLEGAYLTVFVYLVKLPQSNVGPGIFKEPISKSIQISLSDEKLNIHGPSNPQNAFLDQWGYN